MTKATNPKNKIYFSGSLYGVKHKDPEFSYKIVQYMKSKGFNILDEHVAARNRDEFNKIYLNNTGVDRKDPNLSNFWFKAYEEDMQWVDEADYLIAVVDGPSHGVGMEIMRALLKEDRGLNKTKILCLISEGNLDKLSWMVRGVPKEYDNYFLKTYIDLKSAIDIINSFLD